MHPLDEALALAPAAPLHFDAQLDGRFWGHMAAHGGYLAALLLRAMAASLDAEGRAPRSLTVHFLRRPSPGPARVQVELLRTGGRISTLAARLIQDGTPTTYAVGAFGRPFEAPSFQHASKPNVPAPEACERRKPSRVEIDQRFEHRQCFGGAPFGGASLAVIGGWSRLVEPRDIDAVTVTMLCDGWVPAYFTMLRDRHEAGGCPTVDLTIHFRSTFPLANATLEDYLLVELHSQAMRDGFIDESCRVWAKDGTLLAQTVQHAVRLEPR